MAAAFDAFFIDAGSTGQRLVVHHRPRGRLRGNLVYVHPFAEEMNKSRRMAALQSRALAAAGYAVLQIDLMGCGDSSGEFGDASWDDWLADVQRAAAWLRDQGDAPLWLWGLRAGCLLAAQAGAQLGCGRFLFWQPPASGAVLLQQFLRLKSMGQLQTANDKVSTSALQQRLHAGESIEIAGYCLPPAVAQGMERATMAPPTTPQAGARVVVAELTMREPAEPSPATASQIARWRDAGFATDGLVVSGPAFWQTTEIELAPALLAATTAALDRD